MLSKTPISAIMTRDVVVIDMKDTLTEVERIFGNHSLRHAPVLDQGELVGMLSLVDLRRNLDSGSVTKPATHVGQLMTSHPVTVQQSATVKEVAVSFTEGNFHAIPVLENDRIIGIISTTDVIKFLVDCIEEMEDNDG